MIFILHINAGWFPTKVSDPKDWRQGFSNCIPWLNLIYILYAAGKQCKRIFHVIKSYFNTETQSSKLTRSCSRAWASSCVSLPSATSALRRQKWVTITETRSIAKPEVITCWFLKRILTLDLVNRMVFSVAFTRHFIHHRKRKWSGLSYLSSGILFQIYGCSHCAACMLPMTWAS